MTDIENIKSSNRTETLVHKELEDYILRKNTEIKKNSEELTTKIEESKEKLELEMSELNDEIENTTREL